MKIIYVFLFSFILLEILVTGCKKNENPEIILEGQKHLDGLWTHEWENYTYSLFFSDDELTYTLEINDTLHPVIRIQKGKYFLSSDSVYITHYVTECTSNGEPDKTFLGERNHIFIMYGEDSLSLFYGIKWRRIIGNIDEIQNSTFYRFVKTKDISDSTYFTHYKSCFTSDSIKTYYFRSSDSLFPSIWYKEGLGTKVIFLDENLFYYPEYNNETMRYALSDSTMICGPDLSGKIYVRQ